MIKVGIDFDNTIACYDNVFYYAALEKELISKYIHKSKQSVRDYLRFLGQENEWIELQGYVYGKRLDLAKPFIDVNSFFHGAKNNNIKIFIISHKTQYPFKGPKYDLHKAAKDWLKNQSFYNEKIPTFFELTLQEKLQRIEQCNCDYFIDDLPELLEESNFPKNTQKILFDPDNIHQYNPTYLKYSCWKGLSNLLKIK